jgi:hypothetical protein
MRGQPVPFSVLGSRAFSILSSAAVRSQRSSASSARARASPSRASASASAATPASAVTKHSRHPYNPEITYQAKRVAPQPHACPDHSRERASPGRPRGAGVPAMSLFRSRPVTPGPAGPSQYPELGHDLALWRATDV